MEQHDGNIGTKKIQHYTAFRQLKIINKEYVKNEIFPRQMGRKINEAEEIRHASDYDDFYIASKEESERQVLVADEFIEMAEQYCLKELK